MKYSLLILAIMTPLTISAADEGAPSKAAAEFGNRWTRTRSLAVGVAAAMPAELYGFKPHPESMTFGELMAHIARANYAFCAGIKDKPTPPQPADQSKAAQVKLVGDSFDYCTGVIATLTDPELRQFHSSPDGRLTGSEILLALYVHMAHHRGQAEIYLREKGIKPPSYVF